MVYGLDLYIVLCYNLGIYMSVMCLYVWSILKTQEKAN